MANLTGTSGNDRIQGTGGGDVFFGTTGNDTLVGGAVVVRVANAKIQNAVVYESLAGPVAIDISAGTVSKGADGTDAISGIQDARGTNAADSFVGDGERNWFWGNGGNDTFNGLAIGDDNDRINYTYDPAGVVVNLATGVAMDGFGGVDTVIEIEHVHGSMFADYLIGDAGSNILVGLKGSDTFDGGSVGSVGSSTGSDTVDFRFDAFAPEPGFRGVDVDLAAGTGIDPFGNVDTFIRIEGINGSALADTIRGAATDDVLSGDQGGDILDGRGGIDQVAYNGDIAGVRVNTGAGYAIDGWGNKDTLSNFEVVGGSGFDDTVFAAGQEFVLGNAGTDTLVFGSARAAYTLSISGSVVSISGPADSVKTAFDFEKLFFTDGVLDVATGAFDSSQAALRPLDLFGAESADTVNGGGGADYIVANGGNDLVMAGDGNDIVYGNKELDTLSGGGGNDILYGGQNAGAVTPADDGVPRQLDGVEFLFGGTGDDGLYGNYGAEQLFGEDRADTILGGQGVDTLDGGSGADVLNGNRGDDILIGGAGADRFVFSIGNDTANDFSFAEGDRIAGIAFASASVTGGVAGAVISDGVNTLTLVGIDAGQLGADWFT